MGNNRKRQENNRNRGNTRRKTIEASENNRKHKELRENIENIRKAIEQPMEQQ